MKVKTIGLGVILLALGAVAGYFIAPRADLLAPVAEKGVHQPKAVLADKGDEASMKALRARIRELEKDLAEKSVALSVPTNLPSHVQDRPPEPGNFRERMERMKAEEPERYAQMTNRFAHWRQRRAEQQKARMEFFSSIDTSHMDMAARIVHTKLQELTASREELERRLHDENLTDDERHELWDQMREANRQIWSFNEVERKNLIEETAKALGFEGDDVKDISATMHEIIRATDNFGGHGPGGHHGRGRGGPPPRP